MSSRSDAGFLGLFAAALWITAAWILSRSALVLPTRNPSRFIHLHGASLLLFAAGPVLAGLAMALAARRAHRGGALSPESVTAAETAFFLLGIASLIAGFLMADRMP